MLALERVVPASPTTTVSHASPLHLEAWRRSLTSFPDRSFTNYLLRGIQFGFHIGVPPGFRGKPVPRNLQSAYQHQQVVEDYLEREEKLGRVCRVAVSDLKSRHMISPFGVIPKRNRPEKWRLIVNLSAREGSSINDAISTELSSVCYASIDDAIAFIRELGKGCLLAKLDLMEAYRAVPVHPMDQHLLAMKWGGVVYIDRALPFSLRSAPKIFSALTDAMLWILHSRGVQFALHYLDDFLVLGPADSPSCDRSLSSLLDVCNDLGFPVAVEKTEGPSTCITFLGIEIDTVANQLRLPRDKLDHLHAELQKWLPAKNRQASRRSGTKRELLSLIGLLAHAARVVAPGQAFMRSLIDASSATSVLDHHVHLPAAARAELCWWGSFLQLWNGIHILLPVESHPTTILTDASGGWGCGALCLNRWFQLEWPSSWSDTSIAPKELVPVVVAVAVWGHLFSGKSVRVMSDNLAVVCCINKGSARDPVLVHLLCALSRNNLPLFFMQNPQACPEPTGLSPTLLDLVLDQKFSIASRRWMESSLGICHNVLHHQLEQSTQPPFDATRHSARDTA